MENNLIISDEAPIQSLTLRDKGHYFKIGFLEDYLEGHKGFIAGGCFKDIFNDKPLKDIDIFFRKPEDLCDAVLYFSMQDKYENVYENDNAVSYINKDTDVRIELIKRVFGDVGYIISQFDFSICKFAMYSRKGMGFQFGQVLPSYSVVHANTFFEDLCQRKINIDNHIVNPVQTFDRLLRYTAYGYRIDQHSKLKLVNKINQTENILEDDLRDENYF